MFGAFFPYYLFGGVVFFILFCFFMVLGSMIEYYAQNYAGIAESVTRDVQL